MEQFLTTYVYSFLVIVYVYIILFGFGYYFCYFSKLNTKKFTDFLLIPWFGLLFILSLTFIINLMFSINWRISILLFLFALPGLFCLISARKKYLTLKTSLIFFAVSFFVITVILLITVTQPQLFDYGLYHYQAVRIINAYEIIPGLSNLHHRLGNISALYNLQAIISFFPYGKREAFFNLSIAILLSLFILYHIYNIYFYLKEKNKNFIVFHIAVLIFVIGFWFRYMYPLDIAQFILGVFIIEWLYKVLFATGKKRSFDKLVYFSILAITIKLSGVILVVSSVAICFFYLIKMKYISFFKQSFQKIFFIGIILILPFNIHHIVKSGMLLYPESLTDLNLPWSNIAAGKDNSTGVTGWARAPGEKYRDSLNNYEWIPKWWDRNKHRLLPFISIFIISLFIFIFIIFFKRTKKMNNDDIDIHKSKSNIIKNGLSNNVASFLLFIPYLCSIIFWFLYTPTLRFSGFLFFIPLIFIWLLTINVATNNQRKFIYGFIVLILLVSLGSSYQFYTQKLKINSFVYPAIPVVKITKQKTKTGIIIYQPQKSDQIWDTDLFPNTPYFNEDLDWVKNSFRINQL